MIECAKTQRMLVGGKGAPASHDIASVGPDHSACPATVRVYAVRSPEKTADRMKAEITTDSADRSSVLARCAAFS